MSINSYNQPEKVQQKSGTTSQRQNQDKTNQAKLENKAKKTKGDKVKKTKKKRIYQKCQKVVPKL